MIAAARRAALCGPLCLAMACAPLPPPADAAPPPADAAAAVPASLEGPAIAAPGAPGLHGWAHAFAPGPEALHEVFHDRLAAGPMESNGAIRPFADAIERDGASWVLAGGGPQYLPRAPDGFRAWPPGRRPHEAEPPDALWTIPPDADPAPTDPGAVLHRRDIAGHTFVFPVVAAPACAACHDWPAGSVVGAYRYRFEELADD